MGNKLQHGHVDADDGGALSPLAGVVPTGGILPYGGSSAPSGYVLCDGSAVSRTTYAALFSVLGTAFGAGDGSTTFNVPDCRGRMCIGMDNMGGTSANRVVAATSMGQAGGAETVTLTINEIPSHKHTISCNDSNDAGSSEPKTSNGSGTSRPMDSNNTGGSGAHNNMPPYLAVNAIIKT